LEACLAQLGDDLDLDKLLEQAEANLNLKKKKKPQGYMDFTFFFSLDIDALELGFGSDALMVDTKRITR
jgi:hypothetical protein